MPKNLTGVVVTAVVIVATGTGWVLAPALRSSQQAVDEQASRGLESARRILAQYDASLAHLARICGRIEEEGAEIKADEFVDDLEEEYKSIHDRLWATYPPMDWRGDSPRAAQPSYGNIPRLIQDGLKERGRLAQANVHLLADALRTVNDALGITIGGASARNHAEANRLKAVILLYQALTEAAEASLLRREADRYVNEVSTVSIRAAEAVTARQVVAEGTIDEGIAELEAKAEKLRADIESERQTLHTLSAKVSDLQTRLSATAARRDAALTTMEALKKGGAEFGNPKGAEEFRRRLMEADKSFREAAREARALEFGTLEHAIIAPGSDELLGRYVGDAPDANPTPVRGLVHYRGDVDVLAKRIEGRQKELDDLRSDLNRLDAIKASVLATGRNIEQSLEDAVKAAAEVYTEFNRVQAAAMVREDQALRLLEQSAKTSEQAATSAEGWVREARERTQSLSPEVKERSGYGPRLRDEWMGGAMLVQAADARLLRASVLYVRFAAYARSAAILKRLVEFAPVEGVDPAAEQQKAEDTQAAGVEEIKTAMNLLQKGHNKTERDWTITAQAATANDLLVLFGFDDYAKDALEAYRAAVKGRETEAFAQPFLARANRLENR